MREQQCKDEKILAETERVRVHLRRYVAASTWSREEVAEAAGMSPTRLAELLKDDGTSLRLDRVQTVLKAIAVEPADFFTSLYGVSVEEVELRLTALVDVLLAERVLTPEHLDAAITRRRRARLPSSPLRGAS